MNQKEKKVVKAVGCFFVLKNIITWVNILFSLSVIGLGMCISKVGCYKYSENNFDNFADIFIPFYLIVFGVLLICAEAEWIIMIKHFKFLDNYFGRGFYNIFLGTMLLNIINMNYDGTADRNWLWILVVIISSTMAFVGLMEIFLYFWHCGKKSDKYTKYDEKQANQEKLLKEEEKLTQQVTQNVRSEIDIKYSASLQPTNQPQQVSPYTPEQIQKMQQNPEEYYKWLQTQLAFTEQQLPKERIYQNSDL